MAGRYRTDLRQPHWDRERRGATGRGAERGRDGRVETDDGTHARETPVSDVNTHAGHAAEYERKPTSIGGLGIGLRELPARPSALQDRSERTPPAETAPAERVSTDKARPRGAPRGLRQTATASWPSSMTRTACAGPSRLPSARALEPEPLDLEILALVASMRHVLSSQIHRRFNSRRAVTTTQRRLKRLSDAGLGAAVPVPSPRRGRRADVLRDHRRGSSSCCMPTTG